MLVPRASVHSVTKQSGVVVSMTAKTAKKKRKSVVSVQLVQEVSLYQDKFDRFWLHFFNSKMRKVFKYERKKGWIKSGYLRKDKLKPCTRLDFLLGTGEDLSVTLENAFGLRVLRHVRHKQ